MLVSILIPAYNAERWIAETIASALNQTWPQTEIVVVDDGSSDGTLAVARRFASPSVKVVGQAHAGASVARNRALAEAQGEYVQWLDADDLLARDKISLQLDALRATGNPRTLLSSAFGIFYWRPAKARFLRTPIWEDLEPLEYLRRSFSQNLWMSPAAWLVSRELTDRAGRWDERLSLNDDGEYFCRIVAASERVQFVTGARCYYRRSGPAQLSRTCDRRAQQSLALSLLLSVDRLLALEDSVRTRTAALQFLEHCSPWFLPHSLDLVQPIARRLGGAIAVPPANLKEKVAQIVLGQDLGSRVLAAGRRARLVAAVKWDRLCYRVTPTCPL